MKNPLKSEKWPRKIKVGNSTVTVYREKHPTYASGFRYKVWWTDVSGPQHESKSTEDEAVELARLKAGQLSAGHLAAARLHSSDADELIAIRAITGTTPALAAVKEWARARELTGGHVIAAAEMYAARKITHRESVTVSDAVERFIAAKEKAGKQGERTYRAKLKPLVEEFGERNLDSLTAVELEGYLEGFSDPVTRNDHRKRAVALFRWAYKRRYLPQGAPLEIEQTERAEEGQSEIGIITPDTYRKLLSLFRREYPQHLAALVLAGFCGIRSDEIHGKRKRRDVRQIWEDVHADGSQPYVTVTVAKKNTPTKRAVPLCPAAIEWLRLCPKPHEGLLCEEIAIEKIRRIARAAGFELPDNCFRHSFITYRIDVTKNKHQVALEAGNSETEIDKSYRAHIAPGVGERWFSIMPG